MSTIATPTLPDIETVSDIDGDILQIRSEEPLDSRRVLDLIEDQHNPDISVLLLQPPDLIEGLNEETMGDAGWVKLSALAKAALGWRPKNPKPSAFGFLAHPHRARGVRPRILGRAPLA